jgi:hypothetical protein
MYHMEVLDESSQRGDYFFFGIDSEATGASSPRRVASDLEFAPPLANSPLNH